jgi:hypothetical protein
VRRNAAYLGPDSVGALRVRGQHPDILARGGQCVMAEKMQNGCTTPHMRTSEKAVNAKFAELYLPDALTEA